MSDHELPCRPEKLDAGHDPGLPLVITHAALAVFVALVFIAHCVHNSSENGSYLQWLRVVYNVHVR